MMIVMTPAPHQTHTPTTFRSIAIMQRRSAVDAIRRAILSVVLVLALCAVVSPTAARADDEPTSYDARVEGYTPKMQLDGGSTALTWLLLVVLGVLTIAVLFKDAKRTHLD
jgi:hypothetical protein